MNSRKRLSAALFIAVVFIASGLPTFLRTWSGRKIPDDFLVVYSAARAMSNQVDIYAGTGGMYIYSPFLAFIFQPLAALPERAAAIVWLILSASIIFAASLIAARKVTESWRLGQKETDPSIPWLISAASLLLSFTKIRSDFTLGQYDCLILVGLVGILWWMDRRPALAGIAAGATANIKYLALIFVPYFLIKRNYRAAIASIVSFLFFFSLPALEVGLRSIKTYAIDAIAVLNRVADVPQLISLTTMDRTDKPIVNSVTWDHSVSLTSSILRLTRSHAVSDFIGATLIVVLFGAIVTAIVLIGRRHGVNLFQPATANTASSHPGAGTIEWAVLIVLALVFGPQTTARHMILLILVYTVAIAIVFSQKRRGPQVVLIVSMLATAVALSLPFRETGHHPWLIALKSIGTASWCALLLILSIAWIGSRTISKEAASPTNEVTPLRSFFSSRRGD
ncbi:MAG TPA: glycosyltransferase family 87 protein [Chthoniobacterales bacterium]|nr:glycosyltransferase family 87 protein [Chthoniobacterales bacterium]